MKPKLINGKKHFEKKVIRFYEDDNVQEFTVLTKKELLDQYREYLDNARDPRYAAAVADDTFQIGRVVKGYAELCDSKDDEITVSMMRDSGFILWYNQNEFMAWVGDNHLLEVLGGDFVVK